jgi:hypothetical protein
MDGEEAADEMVRWRQKRALGRVIRPRWWRRWLPGLAKAARRRRSSHQRERGEEKVHECGAGLGRWFDPDPSRAAKPSPNGPVGPGGQQASWAKRAFANLISIKISNLNVISFLEFKSNSKIQITLIKHFLIL